MSSPTEPEAAPTAKEIRLAELMEGFESRRTADASIGVGSMRLEAGADFPELCELEECLGLFRRGLGEGDDEVPASFGPYVIEAKLGEGVSGVVYRAHRDDGPPLALKVMRESLSLSGEAVERFRREARVAERLEHPHVVRVLDHGEHAGRLFLVMEYVDGVPLSELLDRIRATGSDAPDAGWLEVLDAGGVPPLPRPAASPAGAYASRMAGLFAGPARALAAAARAGLVHRDLKPGNLLLRGDGRLLIADFGLAKVVGEDLTTTVAVLGTPVYMSPEQAAGDSRNVGPQTDIYGLAAALYYALTLSYPVHGESFSDILAAIVQKRPEPLTRFCADYPKGLDRIVARCLEKLPENRYPDGDALAADFERVSTGRQPRLDTVPMARRIRQSAARHQRLVALSGAALLAIAVALTWWMTQPALLVVRSIPAAELALNGKRVGTTDWSGELERGEYAVRVTRERFEAFEDRIRLRAGDERSVTVPLRPLDPFDAEALRVVASAVGFDARLPTGQVPRPRGLADGELLLPQRVAKVRRGAEVLLVYMSVPSERRLLVDGESGGPLAGGPGEVFVRLPELADGEHVVRIEDGAQSLEVRLEVVSSDVGGLPPELAETDHGRLLRANELVAREFFMEALEVLQPVLGRNPDRGLPCRLALAAVGGLGMRESPLYHELFARHEDAER